MGAQRLSKRVGASTTPALVLQNPRSTAAEMAQTSASAVSVPLPREIKDLVIGDASLRPMDRGGLLSETAIDKISCLRDLCSLALTCKSWNVAVNPKLYADLYITMQEEASNLAYLESLVYPQNLNFRFISGIHVVPPQIPGDDSKTTYSSCSTARDDTNSFAWSKNTVSEQFIMLFWMLIQRIPKGNMKRFIWAVNWSLYEDLIVQFLQIHITSLVHLQCDGYAIKEPTASDGRRLENLVIHNVESLLGPWTSTLLLSRQTLSCLTMGCEKSALVSFLGQRVMAPPTSFESELLLSLSGRSGKPGTKDPILRLEHLKMINLNPSNLLADFHVPFVSFSSLTSLILESCQDLSTLFAIIMSLRNRTEQSYSLKNLRALTIRHEQSSNVFRAGLQSFLCHLCPLRTLRVMLQGAAVSQDLRPILEVHGTSLKCLLWDERGGRRMSIAKPRDIHANGIGYLERISEMCPFLTELGISVRWGPQDNTNERNDQHVKAMQVHQKKIGSALAKLRNLRTLNIRNMPAIQGHREIDGWMIPDVICSELSSSLVRSMINSRVSSAPKPPKLNVIALGALTYEGAWESVMSEYTSEPDLAHALRRRIYHVEYQAKPGARLWSALTRVATGPAGTISHLSSHLDVLEPYWLA